MRRGISTPGGTNFESVVMACYICTTCGTQHGDSDRPPAVCAICHDSRQYLGAAGQQWTSLAELRRFHRLTLREEEPNLMGIGMEPSFAIGQCALLVRTPHGNLLWDCIPLFDSAIVDLVQGIGGIQAIAISHPHFYAGMIEWSHGFNAPIYLHAADKRWVMRPDSAIEYWDGETKPIMSGMMLFRCGGHFDGSTVLHWPAGADGKGGS